MAISVQNKKLIFGLKVRRLRQQMGLSFADLSEVTGISVSYLNEIEKGKKFPKEKKIKALANALNVSDKELLSTKLSKNLQPIGDLLESNFLDELPLDLFGIEAGKVVELMASAPVRVGAFISTLLEIARKYALEQENFYFAALRSYQELHHNYFEDLEQTVTDFTESHLHPFGDDFSLNHLYHILVNEYQYTIDETELEKYPSLKSFRSIYLQEERRLLINDDLTDMQRAFLLAKEIGFNYLNIKERVYTSSFVQVETFEQVLNNFKASYFSGALLIPKEKLRGDIEGFFNQKKWKPQAFLDIMNKYNASPEMFLHRLTNLIPHHFELDELFFLRFNNKSGEKRYELTKELHLSRQHQPYGNATDEHYCRRWITLWLLDDLHQLQQTGQYKSPIADAQRSRYVGTDDEYVCFTIARPAHPTPDTNVSVTIGLRVNEQLRKTMAFIDDVPVREVSQTCQRCVLKDCEERAAPADVLQQQETKNQIAKDLKAIAKK